MVRASISIGLTIFCLACGDDSLPSSEDDDGASATDPVANQCGNGVVEQGEFCDAGGANNNIVPNACRLDCTLPFCGDGVRDDTEECDLGGENGGDACTQDCISLLVDETTGEPSTTTASESDTDVSTTTDASTTAEGTGDTTAAETSAEDSSSTGNASGMTGMMEGGGNT